MTGKADVSVDDKRRFSLPPKFRPGFPHKDTDTGVIYFAVVMSWFKGALAIIPRSTWDDDLARGLSRLDYTKPGLDDAKLICLSDWEPLSTDPEGRLTLTAEQCEWVGLPPGTKGRLVVIGMGQILHVWNADVWESIRKTGTKNLELDEAQETHDGALASLLEWIRNTAPAEVPPAPTESTAPDA